MQWQEEQRKKREADLAAAAAEDKILAELAAAAAAEKSCYPLRLTQTSRHGCSMTSSPWDEILTAYKAGLSPSSGEAGKLRPPRAENPGLSCRGTRSSNPSPSSEESRANPKTTSTFALSSQHRELAGTLAEMIGTTARWLHARKRAGSAAPSARP
jgi:hypothetical protein